MTAMRLELPTEPTPHISSPLEIAGALERTLEIPDEKKLLRVRGIYCDKSRKNSGGSDNKSSSSSSYFASLRDPATQHTLRLRLPENLRNSLHDGRAYVFYGRLGRWLSNNDLKIELIFNVTRVENVELPSVTEFALKRSDVFHDKCKRGFKRVECIILDALREGRQAHLTLIHGREAVVKRDILSRLDKVQGWYEIGWREVTLTDEQTLIRVLKEIDAQGTNDVIGIARGGGNLDIFNDIEVASAISQVDTPIITALGHAQDHTFSDQVSDGYFDTPTDFGEFLSRTALKAYKEESSRREIEQERKKLEAEKAELAVIKGQLEQRVRTERETLQAERQKNQQQLLGLQQKYSDLQEENRELLQSGPDGTESHRGRYAIVGLIVGILIGMVIGVALARNVSWFANAQPEPQRTQQQAQPSLSVTATPTPVTVNRQRKGSKG